MRCLYDAYNVTRKRRNRNWPNNNYRIKKRRSRSHKQGAARRIKVVKAKRWSRSHQLRAAPRVMQKSWEENRNWPHKIERRRLKERGSKLRTAPRVMLKFQEENKNWPRRSHKLQATTRVKVEVHRIWMVDDDVNEQVVNQRWKFIYTYVVRVFKKVQFLYL